MFQINFLIRKLKKITFLFIFITTQNTYCQSPKDSLWNIIENTKIQDTTRANAYYSLINNHYRRTKLDSAYVMAKRFLEFTTVKNLPSKQADAYQTLGNIFLAFGDQNNALINYKKSNEIYNKLNDSQGIILSLSNIGAVYMNEYKFNIAHDYFNKVLKLSKQSKDTLNLIHALNDKGDIFNNLYKLDSSNFYHKKAYNLSLLINNKETLAYSLYYIGDNLSKAKKYKKALKKYKSALIICEKIKDKSLEIRLLFRISTDLLFQKKYTQSINYSKKCYTLAKEYGDHPYINASLKNIYEAYRDNNNPLQALHYLELSGSIEVTMNRFNADLELQKLEIERIRMKDSLIKVEDTNRLNLFHQVEINQKNKEKKTLIIVWLGSLVAILSIGFLAYKNYKRKQYIATQENKIELQKKEKLLKNLELSAIDSMIEGQEKERQRIANDLHDDLGGLMATVKLHFNALKDKSSPELFDKTNLLIDEAYQKIRTIAHAKNSGVIAKQGLLKAVQNMADKVSASNKIMISVSDHGLENRLENSLELTIFRIIQELVTNVIKHANATETNIHLTNHEESLNIIIEDNGIGFNQNHDTNLKGMGINNIDKRVDHLNGKMTIESENKKGTTTIIDIPL